jgi:hypothetical protein
MSTSQNCDTLHLPSNGRELNFLLSLSTSTEPRRQDSCNINLIIVPNPEKKVHRENKTFFHTSLHGTF